MNKGTQRYFYNEDGNHVVMWDDSTDETTKMVGSKISAMQFDTPEDAFAEAYTLGYYMNDARWEEYARYNVVSDMRSYIRELEGRVDNLVDDLCDFYRIYEEGATPDYGVLPDVIVYAFRGDKAYGGTEEGGWYYDTQDVLRKRKFRTMRLDHAVSWTARANKLVDALINSKRNPTSSVLSDGYIRYAICGTPNPLNKPTETPHYE